MTPSTSWSVVLPLVYGANQILWLGAQIAILTVIATVVRRHRPDAYLPLLTWSITGLVFHVVGWAGGTLAQVVMARDGIEAVLKTQVVTGIVGSVEQVILALLLVRGLVAIAQPVKVPAAPGLPPYR